MMDSAERGTGKTSKKVKIEVISSIPLSRRQRPREIWRRWGSIPFPHFPLIVCGLPSTDLLKYTKSQPILKIKLLLGTCHINRVLSMTVDSRVWFGHGRGTRVRRGGWHKLRSGRRYVLFI